MINGDEIKPRCFGDFDEWDPVCKLCCRVDDCSEKCEVELEEDGDGSFEEVDDNKSIENIFCPYCHKPTDDNNCNLIVCEVCKKTFCTWQCLHLYHGIRGIKHN